MAEAEEHAPDDGAPRPRSRSPGSRDYYRRHGRSRSPMSRDNNDDRQRRRSRSRSGERRGMHKKSGGFKWKDKSDARETNQQDDKLERGYRAQDRRERERYRDRSRDREQRFKDDRGYDDRRERDGRRGGAENERGDRVSSDFRGERRDSREGRDWMKTDRGAESDKPKEKKERKEKKPVPQPAQNMIIVYVNDRLGTKAGIPCLPSDPIKLFKAQVAARIGREPHEIMLKRQGERPFKDQLTLEDYGVGNGVQLDLEVDTGD